MSGDRTLLTRDGRRKLEEELQYLKTVKRREITAALREARGHGDISENAEYDAAKDEQGRLEARINDLTHKIATAQIIDDQDIPDHAVYIGAKVKLADKKSGRELHYTLVPADEADFSSGKISVESPIGKGLLGHEVGETVSISVPRGTLEYEIKAIER